MPKVRGHLNENLDNSVGVPSVEVSLRRKADGTEFAPDATTVTSGQYDASFDTYPGRAYTDVSTGGRRILRRGEITGQIDELWMSDLDDGLAMLGVDGVDPRTVTTALKVAPGTGRSVVVAAGGGFVLGHPYIVAAAQGLAIAANTGTVSRLDRVVVRLERGQTDDANAGRITVAVKTGTFTTGGTVTAILPALTRTADIWEMALATVTVPVNASSITTGNIADERAPVAAHTAVAVRPDAVTTPGVLDRAITEPKLADDAVSSRTIQDGAVQPVHLSPDTYTALRSPGWGHYPSNPSTPWISSVSMTNVITSGDLTAQQLTLAPNRTYLIPFFLPAPLLVQRLAHTGDRRVGTRMAIVTASAGGLDPTGTLFAPGVVPEFATSRNRIDFVYPTPVLIPGGIVYVAFNGGPDLNTLNGSAQNALIGGFSLGIVGNSGNYRIGFGESDLRSEPNMANDGAIRIPSVSMLFRDEAVISATGPFGVITTSASTLHVGICRQF